MATHHRFVAGVGRDEELAEAFWIFRWGPTTDNFLSYAFSDSERFVITFQFCREAHLREHPEHVGTVFTAELSLAELDEILQSLLTALDDGKPPGTLTR